MGAQILKYFWVITLLFLAGVSILSAKLTSVLLAKRLWVADFETTATESQRDEPVVRERLTDYRIIEERNVFNANPKDSAPEESTTSVKPDEPPEPPPPPPRTPLNVTLLGTAVIEGGRSFAVVQSGADLKLVHEGEEVVLAAILSEVRSDRILVDRGGATEEILLYPPDSEKRNARSRAQSRRRPTSARSSDDEEASESDTVRQVDENKWLIDSREIEDATSNMSKLMTQIRVVPNFTDGQPDGFKVFAIRPGSLFAKIGLQNGDVIKRVNGVDIEGPEQAFEAYQRLKDETTVQLDLTRRNENSTFTYEIR